MLPREVVSLQLVELFVLGKEEYYLHISIPPSARTRKTGGKAGRQLKVAKINISVSSFCLSPDAPASRPGPYSAREGECDSFAAPTHPFAHSAPMLRALEVTADWSIARNRHRFPLPPSVSLFPIQSP